MCTQSPSRRQRRKYHQTVPGADADAGCVYILPHDRVHPIDIPFT